MTAIAAAFRTGLAAARPPSARISSTTVTSLRISGLMAASRRVALEDLGRPRRRGGVPAPADAGNAVDDYHGDPRQVSRAEGVERGPRDGADRSVQDHEVRFPPGR